VKEFKESAPESSHAIKPDEAGRPFLFQCVAEIAQIQDADSLNAWGKMQAHSIKGHIFEAQIREEFKERMAQLKKGKDTP
jgi:hypothetical protein